MNNCKIMAHLAELNDIIIVNSLTEISKTISLEILTDNDLYEVVNNELTSIVDKQVNSGCYSRTAVRYLKAIYDPKESLRDNIVSALCELDALIIDEEKDEFSKFLFNSLSAKNILMSCVKQALEAKMMEKSLEHFQFINNASPSSLPEIGG